MYTLHSKRTESRKLVMALLSFREILQRKDDEESSSPSHPPIGFLPSQE